MSFRREHELHKRRFGKNLGLGIILVGFVFLIFGLTVVKISEGNFAEAIAGVQLNE